MSREEDREEDSEEQRKELNKLLNEYQQTPADEKGYFETGLYLSKKSDLAIKALIIIYRRMIQGDRMSSKVTRSDVVDLAIQHHLEYVVNKIKKTSEEEE